MNYYDKLNSFMTINGIQEKLENIYYILDETNVALDHNPTKVVCESNHQAITSPRAQNVAFIGCGNSQGNVLPTLIIPGKRWNHVFIERTCAATGRNFRQLLVLLLLRKTCKITLLNLYVLTPVLGAALFY